MEAREKITDAQRKQLEKTRDEVHAKYLEARSKAWQLQSKLMIAEEEKNKWLKLECHYDNLLASNAPFQDDIVQMQLVAKNTSA